jgi:hypothetical protein
VFVKGVHYIFVYGSKLEQKVTEVHRFRNFRVFRTPLLHADLVGFSAVAKKLWDAERWSERYSRIIWLNAGTIGPLVSSRDWVDIVSGGALPNASLLDADRTVIASTISWEVGVHPQSNFLSCPVAAADLLLRGLYSAPHRDKRDLIAKAEVGAGALLLKSNFLLFELTRRVFVNFDTPPLNRRNTYLEIVPNISNAVFYKHNDQGYKAMSAVVKQEAARLRAELRLDERRVSLLMARSLGFPDRSSPLRTYCTS